MDIYEKKYKDLVDRFDVILNSNTVKETGVISVSDVRDLIPELKESEDEKIRKELIDYLKERKSQESYGQYVLRFNRWIEWLEKRGEKEEILVLKDQIESLHAAILAIKETHKIELEKQSEQKQWVSVKPVSKEDKLYLMSDEQKSVWSEEDETKLTMAQTFIRNTSLIGNDGIKKATIDWLNDLKDRVQPHPKQEWSEEDEETLGWLCTFFKEYGNPFFGGNEESVIDWLKSLKERYTWKPSEEQMKGIDCAIKTLRHQLNVEDKRLNSLYEQLKKL